MYINYTGEIKKKKKILDRHKQSYRLYVSDKQMSEDLVKNGCLHNKSLILKFPTEEQVPGYLLNHFIRGYLDGDGSISFKKNKYLSIGIIGTKEFLSGIIDYFDKTYGIKLNLYNYAKRNHNKNIYDIKISCFKALRFLNIIYKDSTIWLERKRNKFNDYCKYIINQIITKKNRLNIYKYLQFEILIKTGLIFNFDKDLLLKKLEEFKNKKWKSTCFNSLSVLKEME
jgi:hypothetical protein